MQLLQLGQIHIPMHATTHLCACCTTQVYNMVAAGRGQSQRQHPPRHIPRTAAASILLLLLLAAYSHTAVATLPSKRPGNVLTMILTDCAKYQDWQTVAAAFAWRQSGQPGSVIRVANCNEKDTKAYDPKMLDYVETHMAKQVRWGGGAVLRSAHACSRVSLLQGGRVVHEECGRVWTHRRCCAAESSCGCD